MENKAFLTNTIRYQKTASDNAFALFNSFQSNSTELLKKTLNQCSWLPTYSKESCLYWNDNLLKTTENIKALIDKGYEEAENLLSPSAKKEEVKAKSQPKAQPTPPAKPKTQAKTVAKPKTAKAPAKKAAPTKKKVAVKSEIVKAASKPKVAAKSNETKAAQPAKPKASSTAKTTKASSVEKKDLPTNP